MSRKERSDVKSWPRAKINRGCGSQKEWRCSLANFVNLPVARTFLTLRCVLAVSDKSVRMFGCFHEMERCVSYSVSGCFAAHTSVGVFRWARRLEELPLSLTYRISMFLFSVFWSSSNLNTSTLRLPKLNPKWLNGLWTWKVPQARR